MSIKAVTWAFEQQLNDPIAKLVLIGIADRYNTEFGYAYPAVKWLAQVADCAPRTVQRKLEYLRENGFIQVLQTHSKDAKTHGANKYHLPALEGVTQCQGVTNSVVGGDTQDVVGGTTPMSRPNYRTIDNYKYMIKMFDLFWEAAPKKVGKQHALKAFKAAIKTTDPAVLIDGMKGYASICQQKGTEPQYIKHPTTWLNGGCWEDEADEATPVLDNYGVSQRWMPKNADDFHAKYDQMPDFYERNRPDVIAKAKAEGWLDE